MKKKLLVFLAAATLTFGLCGCGSEDKKDSTPQTSAPANEQAGVPATMDEPPEGELSSLRRGTVENGVYTNVDLNLSFPIPEGCKVYSDEEMSALLGIGMDSLSNGGTYTAEQLEAALNGTVYDIWFFYPDQKSNVYVCAENMDKTGSYGIYDAEKYAQILEAQFSSVTSHEYTVLPSTKETYAGYEYCCVNLTTDQSVDQKLLVRQVGHYMLAIALTYPTGDTTIPDAFLSTITTSGGVQPR